MLSILNPIKMPAPTIEFDGVTYTVTLFRADDKKEYFVFGDHTISICAARENQLEPSERMQINTEPDAEGLLYYIHAQPRNLGVAERIGLENKEEALAVNRVLLFLEENENAAEDYYEDDCSFCGGEKDSENECYVDHEDEVREEAARKPFDVKVDS